MLRLPLRQAVPHTSEELMLDHVKFGVSDYAASKAFFLKALEPLGVAVFSEGPPTYGVALSPKVRLHCACTKPRRSRRIFTWRSRQRIASKSKPSIARLWRWVAKTMVRLVCAFVIGPDRAQLWRDNQDENRSACRAHGGFKTND
jgi:hypothetical protein